MLILAIDTTGAGGSVALARDETIVAEQAGDPASTHGQRLPLAIARLLAQSALGLHQVDCFGVAAGPGSFTGLRVGIATAQALAFATGRPVAGVSALEAAVEAAAPFADGGRDVAAAWIDAGRGDVFAQIFRSEGGAWRPITEPAVGSPAGLLAAATPLDGSGLWFAGSGAWRYRDVILAWARDRAGRPAAGAATVVEPRPMAAAVARLAGRQAAAGRAGPPEALRPIYVRRPDAELARERGGAGRS